MAAASLKIGGRKFVVIPESEYRQLRALKEKAARNGKAPRTPRRLSRQDRGDIAESLRRLKEPGWISHEQLKRELGL